MIAKGTESGQVTVFALGLALVSLAVSGVAIDATRAFVERRSLQSLVDAAAIRGANELDVDGYYASGGARVRLSRVAAADAARRWVRARTSATPSVLADAGGVRVVLRDEVQTTFLALVGIRSIPVAVSGRAAPLIGPAGP